MTLKKRRGGKLCISHFAMLKIIGFLFCILIASASILAETTNNGENGNSNTLEKQKEDCTDLARDEETLMVFSTLGGGLTAIDPINSETRWTIADDPPVMADQQQHDVNVPQYLPDPRDGSIYQLNGDMGSLKKLPYTIPQLVANAPCRSSDGILYSGKKSDTWFIVDPKTGKREKLMGFGTGATDTNENGEKIGWATSRAIYLGRTQYTVMMYDSLAKGKNIKPWNITFYDYSAQTITPEITKEYEYIHLTTTSNGNVVTLNRKNGKFLWKHDLSSPVVSAFLLGHEGLLSVPFTTLSDEAFDAILEESKSGNVNTIKLFQSLYVGEHRHGLYALPSLVDKNTPQISTAPSIKLINGPMPANIQINKENEEVEKNQVYINDVLQQNIGIVLGHYNMPEVDGKLQIRPPAGPATTNSERATDLAAVPNLPLGFTILTETKTNAGHEDVSVQTDPLIAGVSMDNTKSAPMDALNSTKKLILVNSGRIQDFINKWFMDHPSGKVHQILIVMTLFMAGMFWYMFSSMRELRLQSENGSKTFANNSNSTHSSVSSGSTNGTPHEELVDVGDGHVRVGKIVFNPQQVLGKGCEGTFVFRGSFEGRFVAVKRLLPECFTFADREVALLRESDAHENVVRYFCTEQDRQFRYIAVELCAATLQDYTEGELSFALRNQIEVWEVLRQAASGLSHLHTLHIVHRDIKPQNVLLSLPDARGYVRVMISDFGLCKKLNFGKMSFSRRSGITGTDGWIAPEMLHGQRTTTAVDIFSLGCVYYYVLSDGQHAFGDTLKRQANILQHEYNLSKLQDASDGLKHSKYILAEQLIADMIHVNPQKRPPARCIGEHPLFWSDQKILAFLQDVSDRVEKLQFNVEPLRSLEKNGRTVVHDDWNLHLDPLITDDLRKYRGYMGASVRDLLRALRNKKHHYHELSEEVQQLLGSIPYDFTKYWIGKFPMLISHTYHAFSICAHEPMFKPYYNVDYIFTLPEYFVTAENPELELLRDPKPLVKPSSPKKPLTQQQGKQRKGLYNFRKSSHNTNTIESMGAGGGTTDIGIGLLRNVEADDADTGGGVMGKRDVFANFKFRRYAKPGNRNYNKTGNNKNNDNEYAAA